MTFSAIDIYIDIYVCVYIYIYIYNLYLKLLMVAGFGFFVVFFFFGLYREYKKGKRQASSYNVNLKVTDLSRINFSQSNNHYLPVCDIFITHHISKFPLKMLKWFVIRQITALAVKMTNTSAGIQTLNYTVINKDS